MEVLWAVMLLAFFTMSRKDNFSVEKIDAFNARHHLTRGDVKIMRSSVLCSFRRVKSNQLNERVHKVPLQCLVRFLIQSWRLSGLLL
jgi:hypothetical protein